VGRITDLIPIRSGRMSASPFAFYRGTAALMAADLVCEYPDKKGNYTFMRALDIWYDKIDLQKYEGMKIGLATRRLWQ
jgi:hypothetical protein